LLQLRRILLVGVRLRLVRGRVRKRLLGLGSVSGWSHSCRLLLLRLRLLRGLRLELVLVVLVAQEFSQL